MVAVTTYTSKGGPVSTAEADANFTNLNTGKVEEALSLPGIRPSLLLDFVNGQTLDPRIAFTRASTATFVGSNGLIQTAAANTPRFDFDPVTLACRGLLIEEQRTNLVTRSEEFDNAAWTKTGATVTANAGVAPDGTQTADLMYPSSSGQYRGVYQQAGLSAAIYTDSFYVKASGKSWVQVLGLNGAGNTGVWFNIANGAVGTQKAGYSGTITSTGNGWYRVAVTHPSQANPYATINVVDGDNVETVTANGTDGVLLWGAQLEAGSFATSYIPTAGSQVTRSADSPRLIDANFSSWFNPQAGTFLSDAVVPNTTGTFAPWGMQLSTGIFDLITNNFRFGITGQNVDLTQALSSTSYRAAAAYTLGGTHALSINGAAAVATSGVQTLPPPSSLFIGNGSSATSVSTNWTLNGRLRKLMYYPVRLTNAQLQALTTI